MALSLSRTAVASGAGASPRKLPHEKELCDLLTDLLGRDVKLSPDDPVPTGLQDSFSVATFVTDSLATTALAVLDLPLSAHLGACLGLLPAGAAEDAIAASNLPDVLRENLYEVVNIVSALFNVPNAPHVKLYALHGPGDPLPADVRGWLGQRGGRLDVHLSVTGYGGGRFSFVAV